MQCDAGPEPLCDRVLTAAKPGRATQMNFGAGMARGDILIFVHADTLVPHNYVEHIDRILGDERNFAGNQDQQRLDVLGERGSEGARDLMQKLQSHLSHRGLLLTDAALNTPYKNTIEVREQPRYPGNIELETRIGNIIRWNAVAMVLQAYDSGSGVGGHIATYLSAATMMEVGFNHVFRAASDHYGGDQVHFQAHTAPGVYARAFLEGRLTATQLTNFRRELAEGGGLPSYPHPRRLPEFWQMPTASMGLSTPSAIYQARFSKYLESRGLKPDNGGKIWTFIGDGEADEPEVLGTINIASREGLDNLVLVINCNLQRLDGPVRGNGKIIQELEAAFGGAGWNVIKVVWGGRWDRLIAGDTTEETGRDIR